MTKIERREGSSTVIGWIDPDRLYTKEGLAQSIGLKEHALSCGRRARKLKQYESHGRCFYLGRDVIAWLTDAK